MKVFIDVNVFIDILRKRKDWEGSLETLSVVENNKNLEGYISALTPSIIYFVQSVRIGENKTREDISKIIKNIKIIPLTDVINRESISCELPEFEDAIQFLSAKSIKADIIIIRNVKHYKQEDIKVLTPEEFLKEVIKEKGK